MKIEVRETHEVPDGPYCVDYTDATVLPPANACYFWRRQYQPVDWRDGLGSPGTITHDVCALFRCGLTRESGDGPVRILKCARCRQAEVSS